MDCNLRVFGIDNCLNTLTRSDNNVVDGDEDQLHKETDESHRCTECHLRKFRETPNHSQIKTSADKI